MKRQRKTRLRLDRVNVVGIAESPVALSIAAELPPRLIDALELRLDAFESAPPVDDLKMPLIATARSPKEGGKNNLTAGERASRYLALLGHADAIDVELASRLEMKSVLEAARGAGCKIILSVHDFKGTPTGLRALQRKAAAAGADVFKIAVTPRTAGEFGALLALLDDAPVPTAVMGMGRLGKASRVAAMACGSVLNYGWLERPNVAGQWSAAELRTLAP
jgi:3-dehydroquinate dehydratase-1